MSSGFRAKLVGVSVAGIAAFIGRQNTPETATETNTRGVNIAAHARQAAIYPAIFWPQLECYPDACGYVVGVVVRAAEFAIVVDVGGNAIAP
jgi:hypothetical protein